MQMQKIHKRPKLMTQHTMSIEYKTKQKYLTLIIDILQVPEVRPVRAIKMQRVK